MLLPTLSAWTKFPVTATRSSVLSTRDVDSIFDTFDRHFGTMLKDWDAHLDRTSFHYPYNIKSFKNGDGVVDSIQFEFALAGFKRDEIRAELTGNLLVITAEKQKSANDSAESNYIYQGISTSKSIGKFVIARDIDTSKMSARFEDGILVVKLNVKREVVEKSTSKSIAIE
jgi:HSP20 family molecular chaperone IbpA